MFRHPHYNRDNFPVFVCRHGNWDIYRNVEGYCAAIPALLAPRGCNATHFGDALHVLATLGVNPLEVRP